MLARLQPLRSRIVAPVDNAWLAHFRLAFGLLMSWEMVRHLASGKVREAYIEPAYHFTYLGFDWLQPWPGWGMYAHVVVTGVAALTLGLGLFYRVAATTFFLGFTYLFLLEKAEYLNHFYLICLIAFLMIFMPAERSLSIDALRRPDRRSTTTPAWTLWLMRIQLCIVYFYAGIAKINVDWLRGEPLRTWLARRESWIGPFISDEIVVYSMSYGGLALDLLATPLLLWRRSRTVTLGFIVVFHLANAVIFHIGVFPWLMLAATLLLFPPRALAGRSPAPVRMEAAPFSRRQKLAVGALATYVALQLLVPLRHHLYPGNVAWTEEGHRFSWRMKLRTKTGEATFFAVDPSTGEHRRIHNAKYLTERQERKMARIPDMVLQFAHFLAEVERPEGVPSIEIRAVVSVSLNSRPPRLMVDRDVDLAAQPRSLRPQTWIRPFRP